MNSLLVNVAHEECLFFDIETVHRNKTLKEGTKEYELFRWKFRDRETDKLPTKKEAQDLYKKKGALTSGYNKIVAIGAGYIRNGKIYTKVYRGDEETILKEFSIATNHFKYFVSFNGIAFDTPMVILNSARYFQPHGEFKGTFNTSGKKTWDLKNHIDLLEAVRGPHYGSLSFEEACHMFGVPSSKEGEVRGDKVSETYWKEGDEKIVEYAKDDVVALINLFCRLRFEPFLELDGDSTPEIEELSLVKIMHEERDFNTRVKEKLQPILKRVKNKEDLDILQDIVYKSCTNPSFIRGDDKKAREIKAFNISEFFKII